MSCLFLDSTKIAAINTYHIAVAVQKVESVTSAPRDIAPYLTAGLEAVICIASGMKAILTISS